MNFILLFGPQAVGKMTVGQELQKLTDYKLFHNHMTIEMLVPIFGFGPETWSLSNQFRKDIFQAAAKSDITGLIFTYIWGFDIEADWQYVQDVCDIFESQGADVYFVELEADLQERLHRNSTPNRLEHKPTKRNIAWSDNELIHTYKTHRLNSYDGEITRKNYIKINNTNLTPQQVAKQIQQAFRF